MDKPSAVQKGEDAWHEAKKAAKGGFWFRRPDLDKAGACYREAQKLLNAAAADDDRVKSQLMQVLKESAQVHKDLGSLHQAFFACNTSSWFARKRKDEPSARVTRTHGPSSPSIPTTLPCLSTTAKRAQQKPR